MSGAGNKPRSTKPYLIRAIYDWCTDGGLTPYLAVKVDQRTRVPMSYVKDGEIVLNLSAEAVQHLQLGDDEISCGARFGGVPQEIFVPLGAVIGIFAKETGQGLVFEWEPDQAPEQGGAPAGKPRLRVVK